MRSITIILVKLINYKLAMQALNISWLNLQRTGCRDSSRLLRSITSRSRKGENTLA
ncbi:11636_t:CDS:2 [Funneliformis mosseae]|uniref:11636_t:CDS:1 n=1 Tax=Funneliformis mosseae TaxID=27381 RepID=A0A9N9GRD9_FUNMO|nr:11636_t:CDS:2 [Funneliformis mosseae]